MKDKNLFDIKELKFSYKEKIAINIKKQIIPEGKIIILKGPNGCGKTTFLKILNMLLIPSGGEILFHGEKLVEEEIRKSSVFMHQIPYLFEGSVEANMFIVLKMKGINYIKRNKQIDEKLNLLGLYNFRKRKCRELSDGEKKRVALARGLLTEPKLLLLDEPDANIDKSSNLKLENLLLKLKEKGISIIMSTHSNEFAYRIGDNIINMDMGKLKPVEENIFKGEYRHMDGHYGTFNIGKVELAVPGLKGDFRTAVLSPNDIILSKNKLESSAQNQFKALVISFEKKGPLYSIFLNIPDPLISHITEESFKSLTIEKGKSLFAIFKASAVKLY